MNEHVKTFADVLAGGVTITTILGYAPAIAALFAIGWYCYQAYDLYHKRRKDGNLF